MLKQMIVASCAVVLLAAAPGYAAKVAVGQPALDFTLPTMDGKEFKLSTYKDQKPVVFSITQSACSSCINELQLLSELAKGNDKIVFVAVNVDARGGTDAWKANMTKYMEEKQVNLPFLLDPKFSVGRAYGLGATPATVLVGKDGKVTALFLGFTPGEDDKAITDAIQNLK